MGDMQPIKEFWASQPPPDPDQLPAVRAKVLGGIEGARAARRRPNRAAPMARASRRHVRAGPRLAVGAMAAALAAGVAAAVVIASGTSGPAAGRTGATARLDAATVLHRAARAVLSVPVPHNKQFLYAETLRRAGGQPEQRIFEWLSVNGKRLGSARTVPCDFPRSPGCRMGILPTGGLCSPTPSSRDCPQPPARCSAISTASKPATARRGCSAR